jgi:BCD family chlorophyll transporter-like MFS transporter
VTVPTETEPTASAGGAKAAPRRAAPSWAAFYAKFGPIRAFEDEGVSFNRLLRLSLFQVTVGLAQVLFYGTLNRVMIVELGVPATIVSVFIGIPVLFAPIRALVGFKSDTHRSVLGWKRVPYIMGGTALQWSGLAFMPFALVLLNGDQVWGPSWLGWMFGGLSFLLVGAGAHTVQTAGLALATDLAPDKLRPKVVALMYLMLLVGMTVCSVAVSGLLQDYTPFKLIQVIQGTALVALFVNLVAIWKQEARDESMRPYVPGERKPLFLDAWYAFVDGGSAVRLLVATGVGMFALNLQDVLLEPYGGEVLKLSVSETTWLTGVYTLGSLLALGLSAPMLSRGWSSVKVSWAGLLSGLVGFVLIIVAAPSASRWVFQGGTFIVGMAEAFFAVGTLAFAMSLRDRTQHGIALGAWGAVYAFGEGTGLALSGVLRDWVAHLVQSGRITGSLATPAFPYLAVYYLEIIGVVVTVLLMIPLLRRTAQETEAAGKASPLELAEYLA